LIKGKTQRNYFLMHSTQLNVDASSSQNPLKKIGISPGDINKIMYTHLFVKKNEEKLRKKNMRQFS